MIDDERAHSGHASARIRWQGQIESVQCRAWIWRYKMDNRTHHHLGFNLWVKGEVDGQEDRFIVAVSDTQHTKMQFRIGDVVKGTAWPCIKAKHDIADYYRAGRFKVLSRADIRPDHIGPPFTGLLPPIDTFRKRVGKVKRYRKETFCYGPKSCPLYDMGPPRPVQYFDEGSSMDEGWMDDLCTELRGEDD
jgi:hypothetical protein